MLKSLKKRFGGNLNSGRREPREEVEDGTVEINGQTFPVFDWSARAFMAKPCDIDCKVPDRVDIKFSIRFPTKRIEFVSRAIVVRIDKEKQELAAYFAMLDEEAQLAITNHFADESMTSVAATASPATPRPEPAPAAPQQPEARLAEERRKAEVAREAEEKRFAEERRRAEEAREAEEKRLAEERSRAEEEARRLAEEEGRLEEEWRKRGEEVRKAEEAQRAAGLTETDLEHPTAAETRLEREVVGDEIDKIDADQRVVAAPAAQSVRARAPDQTVVADPATTTLLDQPGSSIVETRSADSIDVGEELMNDRTEEIKRRAAEIAAETAEIKEDMRSAIIELGRQNIAAFREKIDDAGIMQILGENPQIKVQDHSHAFAFRLGRAEYAVFADWDNGQLCREVSVGEGTRQPRTTDFDQDEALNEMIDTLARMLAALQISADEG